MTVAAVVAGAYAWVLAGPVLLAGLVTGVFPQKLWHAWRNRRRRA